MSVKKVSFIFFISALIYLASLEIIAQQDHIEEKEKPIIRETQKIKYSLKAQVSLKANKLYTSTYSSNKTKISQTEISLYQNITTRFDKTAIPAGGKNIVDVSSAMWKKKNFFYLIKRTLGVSLDSYWRYNQDTRAEHIAVFKQRMHRNLESIEVMDIVFKPNMQVHKHLQCFLRIGFSEHPIKNEIITCRELGRKVLETRGKIILRIRLEDFVRKRYGQGKEEVFLEELTVYTLGEADKYIKDKFLETVRFYTKKDPLPLATVQRKKRLTVELPIRDEGGIKNFILFVRPQNPELKSHFRLERVQEINDSNFSAKDWVWSDKNVEFDSKKSRWAVGNGIYTWEPADKAQFIKIFLQPPPGSIRINSTNQQPVEFRIDYVNLSPDNPVEPSLRLEVPIINPLTSVPKKEYLPYGNLRSKYNFYTTAEWTMINQWGGPFLDLRGKKRERFKIISYYQFKKSDNNLFPFANVLKFRRNKELIEFDWPVRTRLKENTRLYLGGSVGAESIVSVQVIPVFEEHQLASISAIPNQSVKLNIPGKNIDHLKIRIKFQKKPPSQFTLKEMALFESVAITGSQDLKTHLRIPMLKLKEKNIFPVSFKNVNLEKILHDKVLIDFGAHSIPANTSFNEEVNILDHPSLRVHSIVVDKKEPHYNLSIQKFAQKSEDLALRANNHLWMNVILKLLLFFVIIIAIRWVWIQGWWFDLWRFLKTKTAQRLSEYPEYMSQYQKQPIRFWLAIAGCIYFVGVLALLGGIGFNNFLKILSFGHLAIVPIWGHVMNYLRPKMEDNGLIFTENIYAGEETQYIFGFIIFLLLTTIFRIYHFEYFAEQFAILGFYILITAAILKFKTFLKTHKNLP